MSKTEQVQARLRSSLHSSQPRATWRCVARILAWSVSIGFLGCRDAASPSPKPKANESSVAQADSIGQSAVRPPSLPADTQPLNAAGDEPPDSMGNAPAVNESLPDALSHRLLVLLPGGPLLCDVRFLIDGERHELCVDNIIREVMQLADTDKNGEVTWREATTSPLLIHGQFGNSRIASEDQRRQIIYRCDINRNGRMDPDEALSFVAGQGAATRWIRVTDQTESDVSPSRATLFRWLDANRNHFLDAAEIEHVYKRLRLLDRDDNGILSRDDLPSRAEMIRQDSRRDDITALALLQKGSDWSRVLYRIEDRYALGSPVHPTDLENSAALFNTIDANSDRSWDAHEVSRLLEIPADLVIQVAFGDANDPLIIHPQSESSIEIEPNRTAASATLRLPDNRLTLRTVDSLPLSSRQPEWIELWRQWDRDENGSLDEEEYVVAERVLQVPLEIADADGDHRLQESEAKSVLSQRDRPQRARLRIAVQQEPMPVWMLLDADADGRLVDRELRNARGRLDQLKQDQEDTAGLRLVDFPRTLKLTFLRGADNQVDATAVSEQGGAVSVSPPTWFVQMDQNRDGEIGQREFLGPAEAWKCLDQNGDGAIQLDELDASREK